MAEKKLEEIAECEFVMKCLKMHDYFEAQAEKINSTILDVRRGQALGYSVRFYMDRKGNCTYTMTPPAKMGFSNGE